MKNCPYCAEAIQDDAIRCRYCHKNLHILAPNKRRNFERFVAVFIFIVVVTACLKVLSEYQAQKDEIIAGISSYYGYNISDYSFSEFPLSIVTKKTDDIYVSVTYKDKGVSLDEYAIEPWRIHCIRRYGKWQPVRLNYSAYVEGEIHDFSIIRNLCSEAVAKQRYIDIKQLLSRPQRNIKDAKFISTILEFNVLFKFTKDHDLNKAKRYFNLRYPSWPI